MAFEQVTLGGTTWPGAIGDLVDSPLSDALDDLQDPGPVTLRAALVGSVYSNFASLNSSVFALAWRTFCKNSPLAQSLTETGYQAVFSNVSNDGIVTLSSQHDDRTLDAELTVSGPYHSPGTWYFGLDGSSVLESSSAVTLVTKLPNTKVTNDTYFVNLNP